MGNWLATLLAGMFTSWKTSLASIVGAVVILLHNTLGIDITLAQQNAIIVVILLVVGLLAKDGNVSHKDVENTLNG